MCPLRSQQLRRLDNSSRYLNISGNGDGSVTGHLVSASELTDRVGRAYSQLDYVLLVPLGGRGGIKRASKEAVIDAVEGRCTWGLLRLYGQVVYALAEGHDSGIYHRALRGACIGVELLRADYAKRMRIDDVHGGGCRELLGALPDGPDSDDNYWVEARIFDYGAPGDVDIPWPFNISGQYEFKRWTIEELETKVQSLRESGDDSVMAKVDMAGVGVLGYHLLTRGHNLWGTGRHERGREPSC